MNGYYWQSEAMWTKSEHFLLYGDLYVMEFE